MAKSEILWNTVLRIGTLGTITLSGGELKKSWENELKRVNHHRLMWLYRDLAWVTGNVLSGIRFAITYRCDTMALYLIEMCVTRGR